MKILLANKFYYPRGGDCVHVKGLKKILEQRGHQTAIFAMQHPENLQSEHSAYWPSMLEYSLKKPGNITEALLRPIYSKEVKKKWNALLDDFQPDIVHLHNIHSQLSPIIAQEVHRRKLPVVWTLHDYKLVCPSYALLRNGKICEECLRKKTSVIKYRCIKGSLTGSMIGWLEALRWPIKKLQNYTDIFIAPSIFMKNKMIEAGISSTKIWRVYNFIESEKFHAQTDKRPYYVFLGRLSSEKGIKTLLKTAKQMPDFNLKIIGDGPLRNDLERDYGKKHIEFLGYQPWPEIREILGHARFMVIPSEWYENNPLSIIESLGLGTPVLGANIGGIPELIHGGVNGSLFRSGDVEDLREKIEWMWAQSGRAFNCTQISDDAKRTYSSELYYKELMKIYNNVWNEKKKHRFNGKNILLK